MDSKAKVRVPTQRELAETIMPFDRARDEWGTLFENGDVAGLWYHAERYDNRWHATVHVDGNEAGVCDRANKIDAVAAAAQDAIEYCHDYSIDFQMPVADSTDSV